MTCPEVLQIVIHKFPQDMTRAERAVVYRHLFSCAKCMTALRNLSSGPPSVEEVSLAARMNAADMSDPEFVQTLRGK